MAASERIFILALMATAALFYAGTLGLPGRSFDSLGIAAMPRALTIGIFALSALLLLQGFRAAPANDAAEGEQPARIAPALLFSAATVGYVVLLHFRALEFALATTLFLFVSMVLLQGFERRSALVSLLISAGMAYGLRYIFTEVWVVNLH